jgi:hypothetical protein
MLERGVNVATVAVSAGALLNSFIASRELVSVHVTDTHRLPFFDRTLDIVHAAAGDLDGGSQGRSQKSTMGGGSHRFTIYRSCNHSHI